MCIKGAGAVKGRIKNSSCLNHRRSRSNRNIEHKKPSPVFLTMVIKTNNLKKIGAGKLVEQALPEFLPAQACPLMENKRLELRFLGYHSLGT